MSELITNISHIAHYLFLLFFVTGIFITIMVYYTYMQDCIERIISSEELIWRSRANSGGHGIAYDRKNNKVNNDVEADECLNKAEFIRKNKNKLLIKKSLRWFKHALFLNIKISLFIIGVLTLLDIFIN